MAEIAHEEWYPQDTDIFHQGDEGSIMFVIEDGKAFERAVVTGARRDGLIEIVQGVAEGQPVVTAGQQRLRNGAAVEIVQAAAMSQG